MIHEIRSIKLLEGVRGEPPSDLAAVAECLLRLSQFVTDHPNIRNWTSIPLLVYPRGKGAMVADARIILSENRLIDVFDIDGWRAGLPGHMPARPLRRQHITYPLEFP